MRRRDLLLGLGGAALEGQEPTTNTEVKVYRKPRALSASAATEDWTDFLGPRRNATSNETKLSRKLPAPLVWEFQRGTGYSSPAIQGDRLVYLHRVGNRELVECLHPETGARWWQMGYGTTYEDRYGYNNGPRSSPLIDNGKVYTVSAQGVLHCLELKTGKIIWKRELHTDYKVSQDFFGTASTPLLEGKLLIINVGAPNGPCVVALDKETGKEAWQAGKEWGPSYASPMAATVHGKRRAFVFAGGESNPPTGGLLCIDPTSGKIDFSLPWRSRSYESVNASCPVIFGNKVFISATYRTGGTLIEIQPDFTPKTLFKTSEFGLHFNTPLYKDGYLYGFDGRNEPDASLACLDTKTGQIAWRATPEWDETFEVNGQKQQRKLGTFRGTLLAVDGQYLCLGELGHLLWLDLTPKGHKEISRAWLFAARESWSLPVLSHGLLYVNQNSRDLMTNSGPRLRCYDLRA